LLPASTPSRQPRELMKLSGRTQEIQRLISRSLRACLDLEALGERTLQIDCDVLQADAGTRTAAISGAWVALALGLRRLEARGVLNGSPLREQVAAGSVGVVDGALEAFGAPPMYSPARLHASIAMLPSLPSPAQAAQSLVIHYAPTTVPSASAPAAATAGDCSTCSIIHVL
jgi:hypothetical protein